MDAIHDWINDQVKSNDVVLFMKGTPTFPQCGFSGQVVQILDYLGVPYSGVNVLESDELRQGIKAFSDCIFGPGGGHVDFEAVGENDHRGLEFSNSRELSPNRAANSRAKTMASPSMTMSMSRFSCLSSRSRTNPPTT